MFPVKNGAPRILMKYKDIPYSNELQPELVTLRRYCVHSTLVPAIVPRFFFPHDWKIHMKELLLSNGRGLDEKRIKRGSA